MSISFLILGKKARMDSHRGNFFSQARSPHNNFYGCSRMSFSPSIHPIPRMVGQLTFLHRRLDFGMAIAQGIDPKMMRLSNHALPCLHGKLVTFSFGFSYYLFSAQLPSYVLSSPQGFRSHGTSGKTWLSTLASTPCLYVAIAYIIFHFLDIEFPRACLAHGQGWYPGE